MYKLEYLPSARKDMLEIARYISKILNNLSAAERLITEMVEKAERLTSMPYIKPVYIPVRPLSHQYRKVRVGNYLMFYWIDEEEKTMTVASVIYAKRDYEELL